MKCRSRNKAWLGAAISAATQIAGAGINYFQQRKANRKKLQQQYIADSLEMQNNIGENANNDLNNYYDRVELIPQFPYGGNTNLKPNIVRGGHAIDLGNNLYLMSGRKHSQGGIDIGNNPRTGIEVEGNEVVQTSPSSLRVFSAQPILGGISPAEYILGGANPNKVFAAQENWKRINRVKDDGTKYITGGNTNKRNFLSLQKRGREVSTIEDAPVIEKGKYLSDDFKKYYSQFEDYNDYLTNNKLTEEQRKWSDKQADYYYNGSGIYQDYADLLDASESYEGKRSLYENEHQVPTGGKTYKLRSIVNGKPTNKHLLSIDENILNYIYDEAVRGNVDPRVAIALATNESNLGQARNKDGKLNAFDLYSYWRGTDSVIYPNYKTVEPYNNLIKKYKDLSDSDRELIKDLTKRYTYMSDRIHKYEGNNVTADAVRYFLSGKYPGVNVGKERIDKYNKLVMSRFDELMNDDRFKSWYNSKSKKEFGGNDFEPIKQREDFKPSKFKTILRKLYAGTDESSTAVNRYGDFTRMYFGVPLKDGYLYKSHYKPTKSKNPDATYYGVKDINFIHDVIELYNHPGPLSKPKTGVVDGYSTKGAKQYPWEGDYISFDLLRELNKGNKVKLGRTPHTLGPGALGRFTVGRGKDENGEYLSYYDLWDVDSKVSHKAEERGFAKPYEIYDRIYGTFDADGTFHPKGEIGESYITAEKKYGGIHIKPSKRGTFTAAAKKHGMGVQAFASKVLANKDDYSPAMVKKANFARNASKWNHKEFGGDMDFNYIIGKNNIYKLGGRRKDPTGLGIYFPTTQDLHKGILYDRDGNALFDTTDIEPSIVVADRVYKTPDLTSVMKETDDYIANLNLDDNINIPNVSLNLDSNLKVRPMKYRNRDKGYKSKDLKGDKVTFDENEENKVVNPNGKIGSDEIGLGINLLGNLASSLINRATINSLDYGNAPTPLRAVKLKTKYNINPQLDNIREEVARGENDVTQNTASSKTALSRRQSLRGRGLQYANQLEGQKENIETELINRDRFNQQQVGNRNIERFNTWYRGLVDFENNRRNLRAENAVAGINNAADAIAGPQGYIARRERRLDNDMKLRRDLLDLKVLSLLNPNAKGILDPEMKKAFDEYERLLRRRRGTII